jgi:D-alanyl-D-alanine carboxypeptidase
MPGTGSVSSACRRAGVWLTTMAVCVSTAVSGTAGPAGAAVPEVASQWASLMYRSLNPAGETDRLRARLADQRADVRQRETAAGKALTVHDAAVKRTGSAQAKQGAAAGRLASAKTAEGKARARVTAVSEQRPYRSTTVTAAKRALAAAVKARKARAVQASKAAAELRVARSRQSTAAAALAAAERALDASTAVMRQTEQALAAAGYDPELARQAAVLARDVVNQVRPVFVLDDTIQVYGVTVHRVIAYPFQRMVDDAAAAGIVLSGGGFRTTQRQIELRTINGCPDVWTAPASSCKVPTAIPGRSLHEIGLAVDITAVDPVTGKARTINDRNSPAFLWLADHADEYGLVNLPSEPWHWSISGA